MSNQSKKVVRCEGRPLGYVDLKKAELVHEYKDRMTDDLYYVHEALYRSKSGFVLYGRGGAGTIYAKQIERNWTRAGEATNSITEQEARDWALDRECPADVFEKYFGTQDL